MLRWAGVSYSGTEDVRSQQQRKDATIGDDTHADTTTCSSPNNHQPEVLKQAYSKTRSLSSETAELSSQSTSVAGSSSVRDGDDHPAKEACRDIAREVNEVVVLPASKGHHDGPSSSSSLEKAVEDEEGDLFFDSIDPEYEIAVYADGMTVYPSDGRPAFVPPGRCAAMLPDEFLEMADYDEVAGRNMWEQTKKWREENKIWSIHTRPNKRFQSAKRYYPSCYYGVSREGFVLEYSFPGQMKPKLLFPTKGAIDEMLDHHCFMAEYSANALYTDRETWERLGKEPVVLDVDNPTPTGRGLIMVMDLKGSGPHLLNVDVFTFLKRMARISQDYYPEYLARVLVINSPFWVAGVFATIKPFLPDILEVDIVSEANTLNCLRSYVDDDQLPQRYGGSCPYPMHEHPFELKLHQAVADAAAYSTKPAASRQSASAASNASDSLEDTTSNKKATSTATSDRAGSRNQQQAKQGCIHVPCYNPYEDDNVNIDEDAPTLLPPKQDFNFLRATRNFWGSIVNGFPCGGNKAKALK